MSHPILNKRLFYLVGLLAVATCVAAISKGVLSAKPNSQEAQIKIRSRAVGLQVVSKEIKGQFLRVTVKNGYGKGITSLDVALGGSRSMQSELLSSDESFPAGGTLSEEFDVDADLLKEGATFLAVVFEDGTGDGDAGSLRKMLDIRAGERRQFERAIPLLRNVENSPDNQFDGALANLPSTLVSLSVPADQKLSGYEKAGFENALKKISTEVDFITHVRLTEGRSKATEKLHGLTLRKERYFQCP